MELLDVLKKPAYFGLAAFSSVFMFFFYPWVQTFGVQTDLWYKVIPPLNLGLFLAFIVVFGLFLSFQVSRFRGPKVCKIEKGAPGWAGTAFGFIVGICPACLGFAGLFLPLAVVTFLVVLGPAFMLLSIGLMLLGIHLNGGFREAGKKRQ